MIPNRPIVAICVPCFDYVRSDFAFSFAGLVYSSNINPVLISGRNSIVTVARDGCIEQVKTTEQMLKAAGRPNHIEWIFFMDSDMVVPPDTLNRLIAHDKDIVGAAYVRRTPPFDLMVKTLDDQPAEVNTGLYEVAGLPTGCLLIRRSVFFKFKKPIFRLAFDEATGQTYGEDVVFCAQARRLGYKIWLDVDLTKEIGHIAEQPLYPDRGDAGEMKVQSLGGNHDMRAAIGEAIGHA